MHVGGVALTLLRPDAPEDLIDEDAFADDEFLPYWAELWPAAHALAAALPPVAGLRVVELGCGLGLPSLVAAARGADVTATDWAPDAVELLRRNAAANGLDLTAEVRDWRLPWPARFDLVLAADVLYERRNVEPLLDALRATWLPRRCWHSRDGRTRRRSCGEWPGGAEEIAERLVRLTPAPE